MSQSNHASDTTMLRIARLLADEEVNSGSEDSPQAFARVLELLRNPLVTLVGAQGHRALLARALSIAKAHMPALAQVTVLPNGSLAGWENLRPEELGPGELQLTAQLLTLLATFIGNTLVIRILLGVWPDSASLTAVTLGESDDEPTR